MREAFTALRTFVRSFDPISLLSQLALTFMFIPEDRFQPESSEVFKWQRHTEFLTALFLSQPYAPGPVKAIDGDVISRVDDLSTAYFDAVMKHLIRESTKGEKLSEQEIVLAHAKIHSLYVRGDQYPHQYRAFALGLYGPHDAWFRRHLGFTIAEAVSLSEAMALEYGKRFNRSLELARSEAPKMATDLIEATQFPESARRELETRIGCGLHFGAAETLLGFTAEELSEFSGIPIEISTSFLARMSQEFGYRNSSFPQPFEDALTAPWDFNTLNERPLVRRGSTYWLFVMPMLNASLQSTFYFDLLKDTAYWPTFEEASGRSLEAMTAECLCRVFPPPMTVLNPLYPDGKELADVLVMHDHKLLIVQCKSKKLTHPSKMGSDFGALRADIKGAVADAFRQGIRARDYLQATPKAVFTAGRRQATVDMKQVNGLYLICVTSTLLQNLAARLANTNSALGLFGNGEYPWSLSLGDLDVITQVLNSPAHFIHYLLRRLEVERTPFQVQADEMDFLGFYLSHGLNFGTADFEGYDAVGLSGMSDDVDQWVFERFECGKPVPPPRSCTVLAFCEFLADVERTEDDYRTDCATMLLGCTPAGQKSLMEMIAQAREKTRRDGALHSFSAVLRDRKRGISFVSMNANGDRPEVYKQAAAFAMLKKYQEHCDEWAGFGWDVQSQRTVDTAFYAASAWAYDSDMEMIAKQKLRPGQQIRPET
ncbi:MAG TPA: hypothetical protein VNZ56_10280 [Verrucomicrobiae bacterium]|nr:hypothetical protein [Verrucomicrobiae bacterium]